MSPANRCRVYFLIKIRQRIKQYERSVDVKEWYHKAIRRLDIATAALLVTISAMYISIFTVYLVQGSNFSV